MKRVIFVDDEPHVLDGLKRLLRPLSSEWHMEFVESAEQALELMRTGRTDAIVTDFCMPGMDGLSLLRAIRADDAGASVAVVMMTGRGNEATAVEAMKGGAQDYLVKGRVTRELIQQGVNSAIATIETERMLAKRNEQIQQLSLQLAEANVALSHASRQDAMTSLLNRQAWEEAAMLEQDRSFRHGHPYAIIMLDIDHFKLFNDTLGHQEGDTCIRGVAQCLNYVTRATDMVGRYGGEEFIILAPETDAEGAFLLAERALQAVWDLALRHPASSTADRVTVSIGVAIGPDTNWDSVVRRADVALYAAKRNGRNQVRADGVHEIVDSQKQTVAE